VNIISSAKFLRNTKKCNEPISTANGELMTSVFSGQFIGYIGKRKFILNDVYYIPGVKKNIISVSRLLQQKFKIVFHNIQNKSAVSIDMT